jgi:hypothetical protein
MNVRRFMARTIASVGHHCTPNPRYGAGTRVLCVGRGDCNGLTEALTPV